MKSKLVPLAVCCLLSAAAAQLPWQESERPRAQVYALEGLGAFGGYVGCAIGGGCLSFPLLAAGATIFGPPSSEELAYTGMGVVVAVVSALSLPACAAYGAGKVGDALEEDGSRDQAVIGAYVGAAVGTGLGFLGYCVGSRSSGSAGIPFYVVGGLAIPAGAVVGYNLGIERESGPYRPTVGGRLDVPRLAMTSSERPDRSTEYGVDIRLVGVRF
jgi:hypothetical protein